MVFLTFLDSSVTEESFVDETLVLTYILNLVLVSMMSLFTTTGSMPLLVEIYFPEGITSPVVSTFCADMNCH